MHIRNTLTARLNTKLEITELTITSVKVNPDCLDRRDFMQASLKVGYERAQTNSFGFASLLPNHDHRDPAEPHLQ